MDDFHIERCTEQHISGLCTLYNDPAVARQVLQMPYQAPDLWRKRLVLDTADHKDLPVKLEGMAVLPDDTLLLVNDDDFGISGERTRIVLVRGLGLNAGK